MALTRSLFDRAIVDPLRCAFVALLLCVMPDAHATQPTSLTVNDLGDGTVGCPSTCTLRNAISDIAPGGTIDFAPALLPGTITLTLGQISFSKALVIQGPGAAKLSVSAAGASRLFNVFLPPASTVHIASLTLRDGTLVGADGPDGTGGQSFGRRKGRRLRSPRRWLHHCFHEPREWLVHFGQRRPAQLHRPGRQRR
jgi:hypothetical protein